MSLNIWKRVTTINTNFEEEDEDDVITPVLDFTIPSRVSVYEGQSSEFRSRIDEAGLSMTTSTSASSRSDGSLLTMEVLADIGKTRNAEDILGRYLQTQADIPCEAEDIVIAKMRSTLFHRKDIAEWFENCFHLIANDYFHIPRHLGYWLTLPSANDSLLDAPAGHTPIFLQHLECGLRFPLHPFLVEILCFYNIPLFQLHPVGFRRLMGYLFICQFKGWEPSIRIWRAMHKLIKVPGENLDGYYTFQTAVQHRRTLRLSYTTIYPQLKESNYCLDHFFYLRVPRAINHPHFYQPPVVLSEPSVTEFFPYTQLTAEEKSRMRYFEYTVRVSASSRLGNVPRGWIPHYDHLKRDEVLANAGLCPYLERTNRTWASLGLSDPAQHKPTLIPEAPSPEHKRVLFIEYARAAKNIEVSAVNLVDPWRPEEIIDKLATYIPADMAVKYFGRPDMPDFFEEGRKDEQEPATVRKEDELVPTEDYIPKPVHTKVSDVQTKQYSRRQEAATSASGSKRPRSPTADLVDSEENIAKRRSAYQKESQPARADTSPGNKVVPATTDAGHTVISSVVGAFGSTTAGSSLSKTPSEVSKDPLILANFLRSVSQKIRNNSNHPAFRNTAKFLQLTIDDIDTRIAYSALEQSYVKQKDTYQQTTREHELMKKALLEEQAKHAADITVFNAEKESFQIKFQSDTEKINLLKDAQSKLIEENKGLTEKNNKLREKISTVKKHAQDEVNRLDDLNKKLESDWTTALEVAKETKDKARAEAKAEANKILNANLDKYYSICVEDVEKKIMKFMPKFDWNGFANRFMTRPTKNTVPVAEGNINPSA